MERKKSVFIASVSVSVLLASSLLVACATDGATSPTKSAPPSSTAQVESVSKSESEAISSTPSSSEAESRSAPSRSQSSRPASSSSQSSTTSVAQAPSASSSQAAPVQQTPPTPQTQPQQEPPAQTPALTVEVPDPAPTPPAPPPPPEPQPALPPAPSVDAGACIVEARAYALGKGMIEDSSLNTGNSGYLNPPDISILSQESVIADLKYCIDVYSGYSPTDPSLVHFNIVQSGNLIYVLYQ